VHRLARIILVVLVSTTAVVLVASPDSDAGGGPTFSACPATAEGHTTTPGSGAYPPYGPPNAEDPSPLVGCTAPYTPAQLQTDLVLEFDFPASPATDCTAVTALSLSITGTPSGGGYGITAWNPVDGAPIDLASGNTEGFYQQYNALAGDTIASSGAVYESPVAQPGPPAQYTVTGAFDPSVLTPTQLAETGLGATIVVVDPTGPDTIASFEADVTCSGGGGTTTTAPSSTTTTTAGTGGTFAPTAPAQPVAAAPTFTG
jgi:hypothetical protein